MRAWASWTSSGYHRRVVGPFHPEARRGAPHRLLGAALVDALRRHDRPRVLDAGCGPGNLLDWVARRPGHERVEVVGLDADAGALAGAGAVAARHGLDFTPVCADLCDPPAVRRALDGPRFDLVVAVNSLLPAAGRHPAPPRSPFTAELGLLADVASDTATLFAVLPGWTRRLERDVARKGHHLGDNGDGIAHVLHTADTIRAELPAARWHLVDLQPYHYPAQVGGSAPMDWVALARRA